MAASLVSLPPLPQSPLPPSPPCSPDSSRHHPDYSALTPGIETPTRSPFTSSSFGTSASIDSTILSPHVTAEATGAAEVIEAESMPAVPSASPPVARRKGPVKLEDFELIRVLGKGCAGRVLLVREAATSSVLAMKAISKRSVLAHDELKHTLAELAILKRFAVEEPWNRTIAKLHHAFTDRENFYFVMEFYPGGDLATQMEIHGVLGHQRTRFYTVDIVQGLEDLHRQGIICRDLKPENILLNAQGHAVLADFGLSKDFGYRGDPRPFHVVTYPGQPELPPWAGKGAASLRTMAHGEKRLVMDKAYSFVGTSEYLAPEVIKRAEYSYAVDWWALGCIVLEGMCGRVPFRKTNEEAPIELWNRILFDPWDTLFHESTLRGRPPSYYGVDEISWHFIDSLLVKDPMWRLTEPCVKQHAYFEYIDWETVRRGEYVDPHNLDIHPVHEYNTHYFPKLCLEEEPTVDMSGHEVDYHGEDWLDQDSALTNNALYALEQAKYKKELASFAWSCWEDESEAGVEVAKTMEEAMVKASEPEQAAVPVSTPAPPAETDAGVSAPQVASETPLPIVEDEKRDTPVDKSAPLPPLPDSPVPTVAPADAPPLSVPSPRSLLASPETTPPVSRPIPISHPTTSPTQQSSPRPIQPPLDPKRPLLKRDVSHEISLPTGLPGSGLSVSDLVSIPSPGLDSPSRIVRRHKALPSIETIPMSRLSVDLGGRIENLGDDDWEQLDCAEGLESMPNGGPHMTTSGSFFNRVLKRRPSAVHISGLRRTIKSSDSSVSSASPSKSGSPTKKSPMPLFSRNGTKKALDKLDKLKVFPRARKAPPSSYQPPPGLNGSGSSHEPPIAERPANPRRHTESGWFDRRPREKAEKASSGSTSSSSATRSVSVKMFGSKKEDKVDGGVGMSRSVSAMPVKRGGSSAKSSPDTPERPPRVSFTKTPPIVWEMN